MDVDTFSNHDANGTMSDEMTTHSMQTDHQTANTIVQKSSFYNPIAGMDMDEPKLLPSRNPGMDWRYEMRRESQEIVPGLVLGPLQTSKDLNHLMSLGITHIVCVRDKIEAAYVKARFPEQFQYLVLDVKDHEDERVIRILSSARAFISSAISQGGKVFVHCGSGISLSPTLVVAYLMQEFTLTFEVAMAYLQSKRYCIAPNSGFQQQLKEFEPIYKAQLAMDVNPYIQSNSGNGGMGDGVSMNARKRRELEDSDDDDPEMNQPLRAEPASDIISPL